MYDKNQRVKCDSNFSLLNHFSLKYARHATIAKYTTKTKSIDLKNRCRSRVLQESFAWEELHPLAKNNSKLRIYN